MNKDYIVQNFILVLGSSLAKMILLHTWYTTVKYGFKTQSALPLSKVWIRHYISLLRVPKRTVVETVWGSFPPQNSHKHQDKNPPNYGVNERSEAGIN